MLTALRLENIALIDQLELSFSGGFTVFTGETGAGKSLLLDALDVLLGGGGSGAAARLIRDGAQQARIEAHFAVSPAVASWLEQQELEPEGELSISRDWRLGENRLSSRSRLNGVLVGRPQLQELRPLLVDLTAQGQSQRLAQSAGQRLWLDRFAGPELDGSLRDAAEAWSAWTDASQALERLRREQQEAQLQRLQRQQELEDLEAAALEDPGEVIQLQRDQDRLAHGVHLQDGLAAVMGGLRDGDSAGAAAVDQLAGATRTLLQLQELDSTLSTLADGCADLAAGLDQLVRDLDRYAGLLESDPAALADLQDRLAQLRALERRYGLELPELIRRRDALRRELDGADAADDLDALAASEERARARRDAANAELSGGRARAAARLETELLETLAGLGLEAARFHVAIQPGDPGPHGADRVAFLFSANPGQPLAPLAEVASGGEMSRCLLALKASLAAADADVSLVFDEIDTGVSGRISEAIARLLRRLAAHRQVFCVTHQPLIAAAADHHFQVSKQVRQGRTHTRVNALRDSGSRQQELAELAGGGRSGAQEFAARLLEGASPPQPPDGTGRP
ncbi:DNA repair protein RecN [Synechococcus sp. RSCCF101]|uniref:DNA repair protein RecN n=1 Tax=Synechococcus sp. RSCCF101 TaxID=2511069 RepID=UPI001245FA5A|nr:DNA repair protein RecN [Synechococcus sp. RSCCF101]QEY32586.1 DNA repair protein RecN [Synechococcus sp. RSCCF101]